MDLVRQRQNRAWECTLTTEDEDEVLNAAANAVAGEKRAAADLRNAIFAHRISSMDPSATLSVRPMSGLQAAQQMELFGCVSGYRKITVGDIPEEPGDGLAKTLAAALSTAPLRDVEFDGILALGDVLVYYVRGLLVDEPKLTSTRTP